MSFLKATSGGQYGKFVSYANSGNDSVQTVMASDYFNSLVGQNGFGTGSIIYDQYNNILIEATVNASIVTTKFVTNKAKSPPTFPNCFYWFRADAGVYSDLGVTPATNGQSVQQWNDFSGNNNHAVKQTGGALPVYNTNVLNGLPVLTFTRGNTYLGNTLGVAKAQPFTCFVLAQFTNLTAGDTAIDSAVAANRIIPGARVNAGGTGWAAFSGSLVDTTIPYDNQWHVFTGVFYSSAFSDIRIDMGAGYAGFKIALATGGATCPGIGIGSFGNDGGTPLGGFSGNIAEIIYCSGQLTDAQQTPIIQYLLSRAGKI